MDANDDFFDKELNLNCFYIHTIFRQKYPKPAIVKGAHSQQKGGRANGKSAPAMHSGG